jgi:putative oxidoreductase
MEDVMRNHTVWTDRGLLLLRAILGLVFVVHGAQKLFVYGPSGVTAMLASLGLPFPGVNAVLVIAAEFGGGLALLAGAGTRLAAAAIAFSMAVAIATVHWPHGFFAPQGYEFPLTLLVANLALILTGAGRYSVDALATNRRRAEDTGAWKRAA